MHLTYTQPLRSSKVAILFNIWLLGCCKFILLEHKRSAAAY